jgi:hypothetical protein
MAARQERKMTMPVYNREIDGTTHSVSSGIRYREAMPVDSRYEFLLVLTFLGVAFLLFPDMVVACARAPKPTVLQAYNDSEVVAIARAISVEKLSDESQKPMIGTLVTSTRMEVEKVYKGNLRVGD